MIEKKSFGVLSDGREVSLYTLTNASGSQVKITNYGATVTALFVPNKNGALDNVVLGYDSLQGYVEGTTYFGAIVGRYGNRIGNAKFTIDGKAYQVTVNDGVNCLHGGKIGYNKVLWTVVAAKDSAEPSLELQYVSKDGEEGFPGTVTLNVTYTLTKNNELKIDYSGTTDKPTVLNPTNHCYFNLSGSFANKILDEFVTIEADSTTPVAQGLIPTGVLAGVENTPMDFRKATAIGAR
ncbi:MAG TPA: aldose epimerase family protein, partial [Bacteroidota bacterium]|nr:aldose epimerase family protein [Bacteroidota bacterium]